MSSGGFFRRFFIDWPSQRDASLFVYLAAQAV